MQIISQWLITKEGKTYYEIRLANGQVITQDYPANFDLIDGKEIYKV